MQKAFVKNILFILSLNILVKSVWIFMIDRTVQNRVGHEAYGTYQALFNLGIIFQIILDFGLNNYNSKIISQTPDQLKSFFPKMLAARIVLSFFYASLVLAAAFAMGYRGKELILLSGILMIQSLIILVQYIRSNVAALQHFRTDGALSVSDRFLMIIICGFLLFSPVFAKQFKIEWFVGCQILCYGIAAIIAFYVLRSISKIPLRLSFHFEGIFEIIKSSFPYALLAFLMSTYTRTDAVLIERMCGMQGKEQAGIYASAFRLLDVGNILGLMFATMLLPLFGRMLAQRENIVPIIRTSVNIMLPLSVSVAVAAFFFGAEIMHMLYPVAGVYDGKVFAWYMACFPAFCVMYVYSTLLTSNGNLKQLNLIAAAGVVINLSLNFYFIPRYMALGAGIVALVTQVSVAIAYITFAQKKLSLPHNLKWLSAHIAFALIAIPFCYLIQELHLSWKLQLGIYGFGCLLLIFLFRFISVKNLKMLFAQKNV